MRLCLCLCLCLRRLNTVYRRVGSKATSSSCRNQLPDLPASLVKSVRLLGLASPILTCIFFIYFVRAIPAGIISIGVSTVPVGSKIFKDKGKRLI